jgi:transposase
MNTGATAGRRADGLPVGKPFEPGQSGNPAGRYKARHLMESFYCKLKQYRAIATRYDKTARNFLAGIHVGRRSHMAIEDRL